jgi:tetratricopeptide (TPR) repeat protein
MPNVDRRPYRGAIARAGLAAVIATLGASTSAAFAETTTSGAPATGGGVSAPVDGAPDEASPIRRHLEAKLAANPGDAGAWRLLGRFHLQAGRLAEAEQALERSILIDPLGVAAHFDFATVLERSNRAERAADHYARVVELAPTSDYAAQAQAAAARLPKGGEVVQAGFEIKRFDGSDAQGVPGVDQTLPVAPAKRLAVRLENGAMWNTNVALSPTSREFFSSSAGGAQGFLSPDLDFVAWRGDVWRVGTTFWGYFSLNEGNFNDLNLQSYRPGAYLERSVELDSTVLVPRLKYDFTKDDFGGSAFGYRHALSSSLASYWNNGDATIAYAAVDFSDFADDGVTPDSTSRDGWTPTLGVSHEWFYGRRHFRLLRTGVETQLAATDGTDYTYRSVSLYTAAEVPIFERLTWIAEAGWGYRDYYRADISPSRNQHVVRAASRLRWRWNDYFVTSAVFNFDEFASKNDLYAASRYLTGLMTEIHY